MIRFSGRTSNFLCFSLLNPVLVSTKPISPKANNINTICEKFKIILVNYETLNCFKSIQNTKHKLKRPEKVCSPDADNSSYHLRRL